MSEFITKFGAVDITGQRFNKLVAIRKCDPPADAYARTKRVAWWWCKCDCGAEVAKPGVNLRAKRVGSCGCEAKTDAMIARYERKRNFDQRLRSDMQNMLQQGMANQTIADELGVGIRAVARARGALNLPTYNTAGVPKEMLGEFPWNSENEAELLALRERGMSTIEIGRHLGVSKNAVVAKLQRLNAPRISVNGGFKQRHINTPQAEKMIFAGHRTADIVRKLGMSKDTVDAIRARIDPDGNFKPARKKVPVRRADRPIVASSRQTLEPRQTCMQLAWSSPSEPVTPKPVVVIEQRRVLLTPLFRERTKRQCEWVDETETRWVYCEDGSVAGKPYCHEHCMKAFPRYASAALSGSDDRQAA